MDTKNKTKHTQGGNMLNKIVKLIGSIVIVALGGSNALGNTRGNRIEVTYYEIGPKLVAEGLGYAHLPEELKDPNHELWHWTKYGCRYEYIGLKLNFPEELIQACESICWKIHDEKLIQELEEAMSTEGKFYNWCMEQRDFDQKTPEEVQYKLSIYAYILKRINEKNFLLSKEFCRRVNITPKLSRIYLKENTSHFLKAEPQTEAEYYLKHFGILVQTMYQQMEDM